MGRSHWTVRVLLVATLQLAGCAGDGGGGADAAKIPASGSVAVPGATLDYRIEGSGPTCLVIGSATYYPRTFSPELRDHLRLVFVDLRHFARSDGSVPPEAITVDTYADDIERVRRELDLGRVCVIGHSIHGVLALEYARRHPDAVRQVVAIGAPPVGLLAMSEAGRAYWDAEASEERKQALAANWAARREEIDGLSSAEAFVPRYVTNGPLYWADVHYDSTPLWAGVTINAPVSDHIFGSLFDEYDLAADPPIQAPVLVMMGRHDYVVPHTLWDDRLAALPDHQYVLFDESGHTPQLEQPAAFDAALLEFLGVK